MATNGGGWYPCPLMLSGGEVVTRRRKRASPQEFEQQLAAHFPRGLFEGQRDAAVQARWATAEEILQGNWRYGSERGQLYLGERSGVRLGRKDDRHQITIGGSRTGKGVSLIHPALFTYEGSVVAIDIKGELARDTAASRRKHLGANVIVLDPFGVSGVPSHGFNPLAEIKQQVDGFKDPYPLAIEDAAAIAESLIVQSSSEAHWSDAARVLVQALILMALLDADDHRNLLTVRNMLTLRDRSLNTIQAEHECSREEALFHYMTQPEFQVHFHGLIAGVGNQFLGMGEKERGSILSTARTQTAFLDSDQLAKTLQRSDFALADVKRANTSLYLCLPSRYLGSQFRWLRMIISMTLQECERIEQNPPLPVLFVLDEFAMLNKMDVVLKAAGHMAGFGVKLWTILQDLGQLEDAYGKVWETFFGNSAVATFHGISDMKTLEYLSKQLGKRSFATPTKTNSTYDDTSRGRPLEQDTQQHQPLADTAELKLALAREYESMVVLYPGMHPLLVQRTIYYEDQFFMERMKP